MPEITHQCDDDCRANGYWYDGSAEQDRDQARLDNAEEAITPKWRAND